MPVTGAIKFFERSRTLFYDGARVDSPILSENASLENILSYNKDNIFKSIAGQDPEFPLRITFGRPYSINRFMIINFNLPRIRFLFRLGEAFVQQELSNVIDIDNNPVMTNRGNRDIGSDASINYDTAKIINKTAYFEFDEIIADSVEVFFTDSPASIRTEEYTQENPIIIGQMIACKEIGTFKGFPNLSSFSENQNEIINTTTVSYTHLTLPTILRV